MAVPMKPLRTHNRENLSDLVVSAHRLVWVCHERTVDKKPVEKWLSACPQTHRTGDREDKDGKIDDEETQEGHSHRVR